MHRGHLSFPVTLIADDANRQAVEQAADAVLFMPHHHDHFATNQVLVDALERLPACRPPVAGYEVWDNVPFANYVNVGADNRYASWIDVPEDYSIKTANVCRNTYPDRTSSNCRMETRTGNDDGVSYSYEKKVCDVD